jgi:hypothetical protein
MKIGSKVITVRELPEADSRPRIPTETTCDVALFNDPFKQHEMHQQGFTFVRVFIHSQAHFTFVPSEALKQKA